MLYRSRKLQPDYSVLHNPSRVIQTEDFDEVIELITNMFYY